MRRFFNRRPAEIRTAPGERIYAIGDVHGRHDLLRLLIKAIIKHWERSSSKFAKIHLLFLGDIIDRGPSSDRCLALVYNLVNDSKAKLLLGNHEDLLLRSIAGETEAQTIWLANGGDATLASFGIAPPDRIEDGVDFGERIAAAIEPSYIDMLRKAATHFRSGHYFFSHAGIRPGTGLDRQDRRDLFMIRGEFTAAENWHGAMVVHGHSIVDEVEFHDNRIAVDTGAYRTGKLSCLCVQDEWIEVIST